MPQQFVVCISNTGYETSLEPRKIYVSIPDPDAASLGMLRVIDESGEDYLFPETLFQALSLSGAEKKAILDAPSTLVPARRRDGQFISPAEVRRQKKRA